MFILGSHLSQNDDVITLPRCRQRPIPPGRPPPQRAKLPPIGGRLIISIVPTQPSPPQPQPHSRSSSQAQSQSQSHSQAQSHSSTASTSTGMSPPVRKPKARILMELQQRAKLGTKGRPSDEVEGVRFDVRWEPQNMTLAVPANLEDVQFADGELVVVS